DQNMNVRIYKVLNPLARAYFTDCWEWVENHNDVIDKLFEPEKSGFNPCKKTILEPSAKTGEVAQLPCQREARSTDSLVSIDKDSANEVLLSLDAKRAGFLVLADQFYPGWIAELDGKQSEILQANCFTRAIAVPEGKHHVRFIYQPQSLLWGFILCAIGLVWSFLLIFKKP
ncbi:MAG: YfhO family protein, partial [Candidatus Obscuribacterales bacterium]|nr:YfhO family protein [Candidatus Obscuribacterales bacterium]